MSDKFDHILLNEQEAAAILQPHMPNKYALHWLENDRQQKPAIPFHFLQGEHYYLEHELLSFIRQTLNPAARFVRIGEQLRTDHRNTSDRRKRSDRRIKAGVALSFGIDRRQPILLDRRSTAQERRSQPSI